MTLVKLLQPLWAQGTQHWIQGGDSMHYTLHGPLRRTQQRNSFQVPASQIPEQNFKSLTNTLNPVDSVFVSPTVGRSPRATTAAHC